MPSGIANDLLEIIAVVGFIALFASGVILGLGAMQDAAPFDDQLTENETFNATSDPYTYTVSAASDAGFERLDTEAGVTCYDTSAQTSEIACTVLDASDGTVNVTGQSGTDAGDESIDYTGLYTSDAQSFLGDAVTSFDVVPGLLEVVVVFGFVAVLIGLLWYGMSRMGLGAGRRGL